MSKLSLHEFYNAIIPLKPDVNGNRIIIKYLDSVLFQCDCGIDIRILQITYNGPYKGDCSCGLQWLHKEGKLYSKTKNEN